MYSILGRGSFCFNYCLNSAWHGGDQFVALLRWYGSLGFFDSGLQLICIFWPLVSHFPLDNRFSTGFRSGEFAGQSSTPTTWSFNQLLVLLAVCARAKSCWKMIFKKLVSRRKHEVLKFLGKWVQWLWFSKKHNGPTPADDIAPQIITDCGNLTLGLKQLGLWASPPFLQTLESWFPN